MVMATGSSCLQSGVSSPSEVERHRSGEGREAMALHDRLVAYVHAIDNPQDAKSDVWVEHSYALCGRGACGASAGGGAVRVLLGPRVDAAAADGSDVDVESAPPPPPSPPPGDSPPYSDSDEEGQGPEEGEDDEEWEERLTALAPHADHARLAATAIDCLRRVRLAKLAGGRFAERAAVAEQARRLRRALAPLWVAARAGGAPAPGWLHAALPAAAPPPARRVYARLAAELRRLVPRLADRLLGGKPAHDAPVATVDRPLPMQVGPEAGPWLVWVGAGRWARTLGALVHTRVLPLAAAAQPPDGWCASVAGALRAAFADILAEAGRRGVVVGGAGGGAALAGALAAGGAARGALLLAPPLLTPDGPREGSGRLTRGPALLVAGGGGAAAWRGALCEALGARQRLLLLPGADDALRLPAAQRRRRRLAQRALDAAVAEECVRWIQEVCEQPGDEPEDDAPAAKHGPAAGTESSDEEYAHLPAARSPPAPPDPAPAALAAGNESRSIEIVEGRVVSRGQGSTPLALLPPRRPEPRAGPAPVPLAAADIMQLPIVFADDETAIVPQPEAGAAVGSGGGAGGAEGGVTVTSGARRAGGRALRYTRVIVAKRAPLLVRRPLRLVPPTTTHSS